MGTRDDVLVVGGGVVGLACGLALAERGKQVRVVDAARIAGGSSHGNCGTLTPSHALPLAAPGAIGKALRWMLVPDAPLYMKPRIDPALWSWLLRFAGRCNGRLMMRGAAARIALLQASRQAFPEWIASHGIDCSFAELGTDHVFRNAREFEAYLPDLRALADVGVASEVIDGAAYEREEPAVLPGVVATVRYPGDASLRPDRYAAGLAKALQAAGGILVEHSEVRALREGADGIRVDTSTGEFHARDVVMAVGAWSPKLARALKLPRLASVMQPGKGYSITYDRPSLAPKRPLTLQERSVCVSVWDSGYRLGSTMEFSGFDTSLNRRRLDALERAAREYLHEPVGAVKQEEWYGWRPMMVDDVPVIGAVPGRRGQWLATGHGMLGVSMSVATARLVADLVGGDSPVLDPAPYRLERFGH